MVNKKTSSKKDPMVEHVVKEFERYEDDLSDRFDIAEEIYDMWKNKPIQREYSYQNRINVPLMVEGEQTISPRLYAALFPNDVPMDVNVSNKSTQKSANKIKSTIEHYFRVCDINSKGSTLLSQTTLFGTGYADAGSWYVRNGWLEVEGERVFMPLEARPMFEPISFFEIYPHPAKKKMSDALPVIRRRFIDKETLKSLSNRFNAENIKDALDTEIQGTTGSGNYESEEHEYEILEYWGPWDEQLKDDQDKPTKRKAVPYWITVINRQVKLRGIPNPYNHQIPPLIKTKLFEDPKNEWFGVGVGQIGKPSQERVNKIVNNRLDNVDLILNKQGLFDGNDPMINEKKLKRTEPGRFHRVADTVNSVRWMDIPDITGNSYDEEKVAKQDFREATGAVAQLMPEQGSEHRTAMGIQLLQGAAGIRFRPVLKRLEIDFIQNTAMFFFSNLKQFLGQPEWIVVKGDKGEKESIQITARDIQEQAYFIPTGISETINKETQIGQLIRFKEITANDPTINRQELNKRIAELLGFKDIDKMMTPMQSVPSKLSGQEEQLIQQRLAEGASPDQIKQEMLGRPPAPTNDDRQRIMEARQPQPQQGGR